MSRGVHIVPLPDELELVEMEPPNTVAISIAWREQWLTTYDGSRRIDVTRSLNGMIVEIDVVEFDMARKAGLKGRYAVSLEPIIAAAVRTALQAAEAS